MQPLSGHVSEATAYVVADYPYGFTTRTKIRYWLESKPNKGYRFVSQTLNPKSDRWNKPKASTYTPFAAAMYLDDAGHVQWTGIGHQASDALDFVTKFPAADLTLLKEWAAVQCSYHRKLLSGEAYFTINGVKQERTDSDKARDSSELEIWTLVSSKI